MPGKYLSIYILELKIASKTGSMAA